MTNTVENYAGELPNGWTGGQSLSKWWRGRFIHLYTLRRPCAQCGQEMRIDVTKAALDGTAENAGLHLKRCTTCRAASKALKTSSRPRVEGEPAPRKMAEVVSETAETMITTMKAELEGLYTQNRELHERLSKYELASALQAVAGGQKMPWEG